MLKMNVAYHIQNVLFSSAQVNDGLVGVTYSITFW